MTPVAAQVARKDFDAFRQSAATNKTVSNDEVSSSLWLKAASHMLERCQILTILWHKSPLKPELSAQASCSTTLRCAALPDFLHHYTCPAQPPVTTSLLTVVCHSPTVAGLCFKPPSRCLRLQALVSPLGGRWLFIAVSIPCLSIVGVRKGRHSTVV